jgi:hypothetical protein
MQRLPQTPMSLGLENYFKLQISRLQGAAAACGRIILSLK